MPADYICPNCHLGFSVGQFHYHDFSSGYWARTLMVCSACGTMHAVEHADTVGGMSAEADEETPAADLVGNLYPDQRPDRLQAQSGPIFLDLDDKDLFIRYGEWLLCDFFFFRRQGETASSHPMLEDWMKVQALEELACNHCRTAGSLISDWPREGSPCPHCQEAMGNRPFSMWIT